MIWNSCDGLHQLLHFNLSPFTYGIVSPGNNSERRGGSSINPHPISLSSSPSLSPSLFLSSFTHSPPCFSSPSLPWSPSLPNYPFPPQSQTHVVQGSNAISQQIMNLTCQLQLPDQLQSGRTTSINMSLTLINAH